jgi:hypothetical protein
MIQLAKSHYIMVLMRSWSNVADWRRPFSPWLLPFNSFLIQILNWTRPAREFRLLLKIKSLGQIWNWFGNMWRHLLMHGSSMLVRRMIIFEFGNTSLSYYRGMNRFKFTRVNLRRAHALLRVSFEEQRLLLLENMFDWSRIEFRFQVHRLLLANNWSRWRLLHCISLVKFTSFCKRL